MGTIDELVIRKRHHPPRYVVKNFHCCLVSYTAFVIYMPVAIKC